MSYKKEGIKRALKKVKEQSQQQDPEKQARIEKAKNDFWFFCSYYLPHYFSSEPAEYHKILVEIINTEKIDSHQVNQLKKYIKPKYHNLLKPVHKLEGLVDVEPREHAKSTRMSLAYPLWRVLTGKSKFILLMSASQEMANLFLENIKAELEENEKLINDFGEQQGDKWKSDFITLKNGSAIASKGAGASMRGIRYRQHRPDLVIADDIMKDDLANSPAQREKLYRWFKRVVMALGKNAFVVVVNTIFHSDDLPSRLLKEIEEEKLKNWLGLRFSAILEDGTPLWKEMWSIEDLEKKKRALGSVHFSTEYLNEPLSEEDMIFKLSWIEYYQPIEIHSKRLDIIMGIDPATGKKTGDYSAIVTVAKDFDTGIYYVLDAYGEKISDLKFANKIIEKYLIYKPRKIIFESQVFQELYKNTIMREASKQGIHLPIKPIKSTIQKEVRIQKLSPLIENGLIKFKENQKLLIDQLVEFPKGSHDDLPDALEMAISGFEKSSGEVKIVDSTPWSSQKLEIQY
ncbi:phage terminase large subunit [Persephonella sp.]|nr:phage terminase large subunit [Persephonella sp.]